MMMTEPMQKWAYSNTVIHPALAATLDRAVLVDRKATFVLDIEAESLGHNAKDINVNYLSIHWPQERFLAERSAQLKN